MRAPQIRVQSTSPAISRYPDRVALLAATLLSAILGKADLTRADDRAIPGAVRISEIMYNPIGGPDFEFVELYNPGVTAVSLSGAAFTSGIDFVFPGGSSIAPGAHLVVVNDGPTFQGRYPGVPFAGVFNGNLDNAGEYLQLATSGGAVLADVRYDHVLDWPAGPDGFGYSLVLVDALGDQGHPRNWRTSADLNGSPGQPDPARPDGGVFVSEILAHTDPPFEDAIELFNSTEQPVDVGGWYLSDSRSDVNELRKYLIPNGTIIQPGGFAAFYEYQFNALPGVPPSFGLAAAGDDVYLSAADTNGNLTGYITGTQYGANAQPVSFGRYDTSIGADLTFFTQRTFGADNPQSVEQFRGGAGLPNAAPTIGPVVINEVMYNPASGGTEFIEMLNIGDHVVALFDNPTQRGWQMVGVTFEFAPGDQLPRGRLGLVVPIAPATFRTQYGVPAQVPIFGPYTGTLANGGEHIGLTEPSEHDLTVIFLDVDHLDFRDHAPWPLSADGTGPSLERALPWVYGNDPTNWDASTAGAGSPGQWNPDSPLYRFDYNHDDAVDAADCASFAPCLQGAHTALPDDACPAESMQRSDADNDGYVDLRDYAAFQNSVPDPAL